MLSSAVVGKLGMSETVFFWSPTVGFCYRCEIVDRAMKLVSRYTRAGRATSSTHRRWPGSVGENVKLQK